MKALWLTDIHLEFLDKATRERFARKLRDAAPDILLISGDISQAPSLEEHLTCLASEVKLPIYFVLGNHDFYRSSIAKVRANVQKFTAQVNGLHWLGGTGVVRLTQKTSLIGHDGWCDGRLGDYGHSGVRLNDFLLIDELSNLSKEALLKTLNRLGDEAAAHFRKALPAALESSEHVVVVTHVPPFRESAWYNGQPSDPFFLPFFSCKAVGDVLSEFMRQHPDRKMTVLCGHTHGGGTAQILPNLTILTGPAEYRSPIIQSIFDFE
jgi:predicted phosphohydrolase